MMTIEVTLIGDKVSGGDNDADNDVDDDDDDIDDSGGIDDLVVKVVVKGIWYGFDMDVTEFDSFGLQWYPNQEDSRFLM